MLVQAAANLLATVMSWPVLPPSILPDLPVPGPGLARVASCAAGVTTARRASISNPSITLLILILPGHHDLPSPKQLRWCMISKGSVALTAQHWCHWGCQPLGMMAAHTPMLMNGM
ncbi:hypothetical protein COO60DRAFT_595290 [Scenedesmus sp. NREL 46B-D3]|nr:hypothetical protein COO60DRAFT_595290 [Scenedesmus sp. NREL 46B-D3]